MVFPPCFPSVSLQGLSKTAFAWDCVVSRLVVVVETSEDAITAVLYQPFFFFSGGFVAERLERGRARVGEGGVFTAVVRCRRAASCTAELFPGRLFLRLSVETNNRPTVGPISDVLCSVFFIWLW